MAPRELYRTLARSQTGLQIVDVRQDLGAGYGDAHVPGAIPLPGCDLARAPERARERLVRSAPTILVSTGAARRDPEVRRPVRDGADAGRRDGGVGRGEPARGLRATTCRRRRRPAAAACDGERHDGQPTKPAQGARAARRVGRGEPRPGRRRAADAGAPRRARADRPAPRPPRTSTGASSPPPIGDGEAHGYAYHCVNCQGNCAWEVWTDSTGRVTRENQSASYPQLAPRLPDANPRGCNKGRSTRRRCTRPTASCYPMRRVGKRGEGKWKRISWDEAITEVATRLYDTMREKGPAGNYVHMGSGMLSEARAASVKRLGTLLGAVRPYIASYVGDNFPGVGLVYGEGNLGCTYDFFYGTDVAVFWGCNPNTSRIPDAHYLWEGKYNGSKVVVITPEVNSTAMHADLWVPVRPGSDGHLALSILNRIVRR